MTVYETLNELTNNGTRKVYDRKNKMYVPCFKVWGAEVKKIEYKRGYGYKQKNAILYIN